MTFAAIGFHEDIDCIAQITTDTPWHYATSYDQSEVELDASRTDSISLLLSLFDGLFHAAHLEQVLS